MRLTAQQKSEFRSIQKSIFDYDGLHYISEPEPKLKLLERELNSYKVKLENMFSDTDSINEKIDIINELLKVGSLLLSSPGYRPSNALNDYGRHTEMALKTDPNNSQFMFRNESYL